MCRYRYPALWGVNEDPDQLELFGQDCLYFPDFPDLGVVLTSSNLEDVVVVGEEALRATIDVDFAARGLDPPKPSDFNDVEVPRGHVLLAIPLMRLSGRRVRANMTLDEGVLKFIDGEARRREMTRTAYVEWMARRIAQMGG